MRPAPVFAVRITLSSRSRPMSRFRDPIQAAPKEPVSKMVLQQLREVVRNLRSLNHLMS